MKYLLIALTALTLTALGVGGSAKADTIYTLTYDSCSGGCGTIGQGSNTNNFGYIDLHQQSTTQVLVTIQLSTGMQLAEFVNTGNGTNHAPFAFDVDKSVTISGITSCGSGGCQNPSTYFQAGATNDSISGLGTFTNTIACTSACPSGASGAQYLGSNMSFTLTAATSLSVSDLIANASGFYFASDIIGPSGLTGEVAAKNAGVIGTMPSVPEPASLTLFGASLAALGYFRRKRAFVREQRRPFAPPGIGLRRRGGLSRS